MPAPAPHPDQLEKLTFNRDQLIALASSARAQVLWAFKPYEPLSVAEAAESLGKSPQSVHAHVNLLAQLGLLIAVDTRKKRSREEKLYIHAARWMFSPAPPIPSDCVEPMTEGFAGVMRLSIREKALTYKVLEKDAGFQPYHSFRLANMTVSEADALAIRNLLHDSIARAGQMAGGEGMRVRVMVMMLPAIGESEAWYERVTGEKISGDSEGSE
ncbi:MAG: helix-turn-helix domain-containing protein [Fimbriimonadaceae bacterium]